MRKTFFILLVIVTLSACKQNGNTYDDTIITNSDSKDQTFDSISQMDNPVVGLPNTPQNQSYGEYYGANSKAVLAYEWGYALVRMESIIREYTNVPNPLPPTSYRAPLNQLGWATKLPGPKDSDMPTANEDTYYASAVVDLTEPYIISVPNTHDRYYVINVFDMYQNLTAYIGRRATGTEAGNFAIVPPGWEGKLPANIKKVIKVRTPKVWLWGRIRIDENEDPAPVLALQKEFKLKTLREFLGGSSPNKTKELSKMPNIAKNDSFGFYKKLAWAMTQNPIFEEDKGLVGQFEFFGLTPGKFDETQLTSNQRRGVYRASAEGPLSIISSVKTSSYEKNGWNFVTKMSDFGFDYTLRSMVSGPYLGAQGQEEALYPICYTDSDGKPLNGSYTYKMHFDKEPPVNAFWSITAYNAKTKLFFENPMNRYKMSAGVKGFKKNADGSFDIIMSSEKPADDSNWIPLGKEGFYLLFRLYQPQQVILDRKYDIPKVERVS